MRLRVLGVCGGAGVMLHPLKKYLVGNIEPRSDYKTPGDIQWKLNFGDIRLNSSPYLGVHAIVGHPSCGKSSSLAYSRAKKLGNGKEDPTMQLYIDMIKFFQPHIFLFENLTALFKSFSEKDFDNTFENYQLIKYHVSVSAFGNSQVSRERLVIVGIRKNQNIFKASHFKLPKQKNIRLKKSSELEANLEYPNENLCHIREADSTVVCMEKDFKKLSLKEVKKLWNSPEYKGKKKWDATTTGKGNMKNLPGVYRNLADEYPLTARKQNRQFNSKGNIMSPRELARIQGVPDSFHIWYEADKSKYCINKARVTVTKCPPYEIGVWFAKCIIKAKKQWKLTKQKG